jgi:hypothetical protein
VRRPALLLLLAASCTGGPGPSALREFRGIVHCHTKYSHDSKGTYEEILAAAKAARIDFICITDHPPKGDASLSLREGWRGDHDGVLFIQGHELAGTNLLALGIREPVGGTAPEKIAAIRRQGGVSIVAHPEEVADWEPYRDADGMEVFNLHAAFKAKMKEPGFLGRLFQAVKVDPQRAFLLVQDVDPAIVARWKATRRTRAYAGVAANDAHQNTGFLGVQLDPYPRVFRFVCTVVQAEALTEAAILRALREGRARVEFAPPPEGAGSPEKVDGDTWYTFEGRRYPWRLE